MKLHQEINTEIKNVFKNAVKKNPRLKMELAFLCFDVRHAVNGVFLKKIQKELEDNDN